MKGIYRVTWLFLIIIFSARGAAAQELLSPNIGHSLPPLSFQDLGGTNHTLTWSSSEPKVTVLFFFEPRCGDCFREFVYFNRISRLAEELNLEIFAIEASGHAAGEIDKEISRFARMKEEPAFAVVPDPSYALGVTLNVQTVPSTFVIERHGVIISRKEGFSDLHAVEFARMIENLLGGEKGRFTPALARLGITKEKELAMEEASGEGKAETTEAVSPKPLGFGTVVAPFSFSDITGGEATWSPAGKGVKSATVVLFWGALCQPCMDEMAALERIYAAAGTPNLQVIAIEGSGLPREKVEQAMERYSKFHPMPSYTIAADSKRLLREQFGVGGVLPQTFVIGRGGTIVYYTADFTGDREATMVRRIEEILGIEAGTVEGRTAAGKAARSPAETAAPRDTTGPAAEDVLFGKCLLKAETLYRNYEYSAAIPLYESCLQIDENNVAVRERLAAIYQRRGEYKLALEQWEKILLLEPGNAEAERQVKKIRNLAETTPAEPQ